MPLRKRSSATTRTNKRSGEPSQLSAFFFRCTFASIAFWGHGGERQETATFCVRCVVYDVLCMFGCVYTQKEKRGAMKSPSLLCYVSVKCMFSRKINRFLSLNVCLATRYQAGISPRLASLLLACFTSMPPSPHIHEITSHAFRNNSSALCPASIPSRISFCRCSLLRMFS